MPELLSRMVFYKVGHQGSRNATFQGKELEMMQNDELVAFISVARVIVEKLVEKTHEVGHSKRQNSTR